MAACTGKSVGAIVRRDDELLMLYRKKVPVGLAGVAGHIDEGETPEQALKRELQEESGIVAEELKLAFHEVIENNPCGQGATEHEWHVYEVTEWEGEPKCMEPDQHEFVKWMSLEEIHSYIERGDMESAWVHIFSRLGIA